MENTNETKLQNILYQNNETISLTFGDAGENHIGMDMIGEKVVDGEGFNSDDLNKTKALFEENDYICEMYNLNDLVIDPIIKSNLESASLLVIRNGINFFLEKYDKTAEDLCNELIQFKWDTKYYDTRRKRVLNKHARSNVCFNDIGQEPDYENKKGRIVSYDDIKCLKCIKDNLHIILGNKGRNMICEGNRYFNLQKCGIGWHGDVERRKVVAFRLGKTMSMNFNWFYRHNSIGEKLELELNNGDMYIMSEKAVGYDWKKSSRYTLRHSAGSNKYTSLKR
jgi:hypothetical protein